LNKGEPSSKAKYNIISDREKVPWGKVEKKVVNWWKDLESKIL